MDFRVLGPFEVATVTGPVELRGDKRRGLLAYLVVNRGNLCRNGEIVEALWGEQAASGAVGTVQTYVSQLRKLFDTDATIATGPGGYTLSTSAGSVDAEQFELLLDRAIVESGAPARLELLHTALALYRGRPLDEFAGAAWADEVARRWDRLHVVAIEQFCDTLLELDREVEAQPVLERAVASYPLQERFWGQLATARYRAGDPSRALAACRDARLALADALGVDPGPELQELERRILDHDPTLRAHEPTRAISPLAAEPVPLGVMTFLITDLDRSSRLWENEPKSMVDALAQHDRIIADAVRAAGGRVFKHSGDGLLAVFATPSAGVAAAVDAQRALLAELWTTTEPLLARMALHSGEPVVERNGDFFGPVVNRCSRVLSLARRSQILVTGTVADSLRDHPVDGVTIESFGDYRLRDLANPERIAQIRHDDLPHFAAPERAVGATGCLPVQLTSFIGREKEFECLVSSVRAHALTTVTGPGGIGKTRLAMCAASHLVDEFAGGAWFVDLASVTDGALVAGAIASALGVGAGPGHDPIDAIADSLADRDALLILDNCEQLIDSVAGVSATLLRRATDLRVIATSRQPLEVSGETVLRLGPLPVENQAGADSPSTAALLFVERAKAALPSFELKETNAAAIHELCVRLDGIPLALELAAARVRSMHPADLVGRLDDRFRLLQGERRDESARHHTLRGAVDWSYDLLTGAERSLFIRLSVFRGGFGMEAAEAIGDDVDGDVIELLDRLVSRSFVVAEAQTAPTRYRMLETLRAYAAEKLAECGLAGAIDERHARFFLARVHNGDEDADNVRAAINWQISRAPDDAARTVLDAWREYSTTRLVELQRWLEALIDLVDPRDGALAARLLERLGDACFQTGVHMEEAIGWLERALAIREELGEGVHAARVRVRLARNLSGYPQVMNIELAMEHATLAEAALREADDERRLAELYLMKASTALYGRRNREGVNAARAAMHLAEQQGLDLIRLHALAQYGVHLGYRGDVREGFALLEQVWDMAELTHDHYAQFLAAWMRGFGALLLWDPTDALLWWRRERSRAEDEEAPLQARTLDSMLALAHLKTGDARAAQAIVPSEVLNAPQLTPFAATVTGDWNRAVSLLTARAADARRRGNRNEWTQLALALAQTKARLGEREAAVHVAHELLDSLTGEPSPYYELPTRALLARLGEDDAGHLDACSELVCAQDYRGLVGAVEVASAETDARGGDIAAANAGFASACRTFERYSLRLDEADALGAWSRALAMQGDHTGSEERARQCNARLEEINAPAWRRVLLGGVR